jgi:hypothetical protein
VGGEDCADGDPSVHPGYDGWATFETSAGSWDWNCDGAEETESVGFGSCSGTGFCSLDSVGWADVSPACGDSGLWVNDCEGLTCDESGEARVQRCR